METKTVRQLTVLGGEFSEAERAALVFYSWQFLRALFRQRYGCDFRVSFRGGFKPAPLTPWTELERLAEQLNGRREYHVVGIVVKGFVEGRGEGDVYREIRGQAFPRGGWAWFFAEWTGELGWVSRLLYPWGAWKWRAFDAATLKARRLLLDARMVIYQHETLHCLQYVARVGDWLRDPHKYMEGGWRLEWFRVDPKTGGLKPASRWSPRFKYVSQKLYTPWLR